jgi:hypothetical protein
MVMWWGKFAPKSAELVQTEKSTTYSRFLGLLSSRSPEGFEKHNQKELVKLPLQLNAVIPLFKEETRLNQCKPSCSNHLSSQTFIHITLWQVAHNCTMSCSHSETVLVWTYAHRLHFYHFVKSLRAGSMAHTSHKYRKHLVKFWRNCNI